jgi:deoxycytidine triphosphate deaminase
MIIRIQDYPSKGIQITNAAPPSTDNKEEISYDLHVGDSVRRPGDDTRRPTPKTIRLAPNDCLRIETREHLTVPDRVFGVLCSRASLTAEGLLAANLKIDPKFQGRLVVTIFNASRNVITVNKQPPFCSIFFSTLELPIDADAPVRTPPEAKLITSSRFVEWTLRNKSHFITFLFSVLASFIASYLFLFAHAAQSTQTKPPVAPSRGSGTVTSPSETPRS